MATRPKIPESIRQRIVKNLGAALAAAWRKRQQSEKETRDVCGEHAEAVGGRNDRQVD